MNLKLLIFTIFLALSLTSSAAATTGAHPPDDPLPITPEQPPETPIDPCDANQERETAADCAAYSGIKTPSSSDTKELHCIRAPCELPEEKSPSPVKEPTGEPVIQPVEVTEKYPPKPALTQKTNLKTLILGSPGCKPGQVHIPEDQDCDGKIDAQFGGDDKHVTTYQPNIITRVLSLF